jgi:hypothetical protein
MEGNGRISNNKSKLFLVYTKTSQNIGQLWLFVVVE